MLVGKNIGTKLQSNKPNYFITKYTSPNLHLRATFSPYCSQTPTQHDDKTTLNEIVDEEKTILLSTRDFITGWKIKEELGIVAASAVKCRAVHYDLWVRIRSFFGGEIKSYGELLSSTSAESTRRLLLEAKHLNADAVVKLRYQISTTADPVNGAFCYSTVYLVFGLTE